MRHPKIDQTLFNHFPGLSTSSVFEPKRLYPTSKLCNRKRYPTYLIAVRIQALTKSTAMVSTINTVSVAANPL